MQVKIKIGMGNSIHSNCQHIRAPHWCQGGTLFRIMLAFVFVSKIDSFPNKYLVTSASSHQVVSAIAFPSLVIMAVAPSSNVSVVLTGKAKNSMPSTLQASEYFASFCCFRICWAPWWPYARWPVGRAIQANWQHVLDLRHKHETNNQTLSASYGVFVNKKTTRTKTNMLFGILSMFCWFSHVIYPTLFGRSPIRNLPSKRS